MTSHRDSDGKPGLHDTLPAVKAPRTRRPSARAARLADERQLDLRDTLAGALERRVNEECEREDRRAAEDAYDQGALLNELVDLGLSPDEVAARYAGGPELAHERMRLARATTRLLAGYWGLARVRLGLALMSKLRLTRMELLETVDLKTPAGVVHFPASVAELEAALDSLR